MRYLAAAGLLSLLALSSSAHASTFVINYDGLTAVDPAQDFEADCLGSDEAEDCPARAAALEAELVELLASLEAVNDSETTDLFATALASDDPRVQELGLRFFTRGHPLPSGLWENVKAFFFGPDATVGEASAEVLARSMETVDQDLSERYLEGRSSNDYGGDQPRGSGATDSWAQAQANDVQLDALDAFDEAERFAPASRLLMIDRLAPTLQDPSMGVPMTGFVTDAPVEEVEAHFTKLFGMDPYPALDSSQAKLESLVMELTSLQSKAASGDQAAIKRLGDLGMELQQVQQSVTLGALLNLEASQAGDQEFWVDGSAEDVLSGTMQPRAVAVGTDPLLDRTAIRYFGGARSDGSNAADGGVAQDASVPDHQPSGRPARDGGALSDGGPDHQSADDDSGCAIHARRSTTPVLGVWCLFALVLVLRRRRARA